MFANDLKDENDNGCQVIYDKFTSRHKTFLEITPE